MERTSRCRIIWGKGFQGNKQYISSTRLIQKKVPRKMRICRKHVEDIYCTNVCLTQLSLPVYPLLFSAQDSCFVSQVLWKLFTRSKFLWTSRSTLYHFARRMSRKSTIKL